MHKNFEQSQSGTYSSIYTDSFASGWYRWQTPEHGSHTPGPAHFYIPLEVVRVETIGVRYLVAKRLCDGQSRAVDNLVSVKDGMHCNKCAQSMRRATNGEAHALISNITSYPRKGP